MKILMFTSLILGSFVFSQHSMHGQNTTSEMNIQMMGSMDMLKGLKGPRPRG